VQDPLFTRATLSAGSQPAECLTQLTSAITAAGYNDALRLPRDHRIGIFVSLPFDKLSELSLQKRLDEIGRMRASTSKEPA
jgi:hypothetical protein